MVVPDNEKVKEKSEVKFTCQTLSQADAIVTWVRPDGSVLPNENSRQFTIASLAKTFDGEYKCSVTIIGKTSEYSDGHVIRTVGEQHILT